MVCHQTDATHLLSGRVTLFTVAVTCFNVRTKCSENPYWYLQFNQKTVISVPERLHVHLMQTAATGKGRTNKISWLNLPFMLLMSAAGILYGVCSHVCTECYNDSKNVLLFNPLNPELNPICSLLALLAHHFLHVSRIRVKSLTFRLLMSYIYIYIYIYIWSTHSWCF